MLDALQPGWTSALPTRLLSANAPRQLVEYIHNFSALCAGRSSRHLPDTLQLFASAAEHVTGRIEIM